MDNKVEQGINVESLVEGKVNKEVDSFQGVANVDCGMNVVKNVESRTKTTILGDDRRTEEILIEFHLGHIQEKEGK